MTLSCDGLQRRNRGAANRCPAPGIATVPGGDDTIASMTTHLLCRRPLQPARFRASASLSHELPLQELRLRQTPLRSRQATSSKRKGDMENLERKVSRCRSASRARRMCRNKHRTLPGDRVQSMHQQPDSRFIVIGEQLTSKRVAPSAAAIHLYAQREAGVWLHRTHVAALPGHIRKKPAPAATESSSIVEFRIPGRSAPSRGEVEDRPQ